MFRKPGEEGESSYSRSSKSSSSSAPAWKKSGFVKPGESTEEKVSSKIIKEKEEKPRAPQAPSWQKEEKPKVQSKSKV